MRSTVECDFCPADEHVPATRTYTDPQGNVWRLCQRHYGPIQRWRNKGSGRLGV